MLYLLYADAAAIQAMNGMLHEIHGSGIVSHERSITVAGYFEALGIHLVMLQKHNYLFEG